MFEQTVDYAVAVIKVIGVGGAGGKILEDLLATDIEYTYFFYADTDLDALKHDAGYTPLPLGRGATQGQGLQGESGAHRRPTRENVALIDEVLSDADLVFIVAGLGGETGSNMAPLVTNLARERGLLTVALVTLPLPSEGDQRMAAAMQSLQAIKKHCDCLVVISPDTLLLELPAGAGRREAFEMASEKIVKTIHLIVEPITTPGITCVDFNDILIVLSRTGIGLMGVGQASGIDRGRRAAQAALASPLLSQCDISKASGLLVNVAAGMDMTMTDFDEPGDLIRKLAASDANVVVSSTIDEAIEGNVRVSIIAAGLDAAAEEILGLSARKDDQVRANF